MIRQIGSQVLISFDYQNQINSLFEILQNYDRNEPFMEIIQ